MPPGPETHDGIKALYSPDHSLLHVGWTHWHLVPEGPGSSKGCWRAGDPDIPGGRVSRWCPAALSVSVPSAHWTTLKLTESSLLGAPYSCEMPLGCSRRGNSRGRKERVPSPSLPCTYCQVGSPAGGVTTSTFQDAEVSEAHPDRLDLVPGKHRWAFLPLPPHRAPTQKAKTSVVVTLKPRV